MPNRIRSALAACVAALLACGADTPPRGLDIYFIDVDGGAATLVVTPEGESTLIDSGWPGREDRDPKRIERVLRDEAKLERLDHLVTTHWHTDHYGGVEGLARRIPIGHFWDRGLPDPNTPDGDKAAFPDGPKPDDPLGVAYRLASEGKRTTLLAGDKLPLRGRVEVVVLASGGKVIAKPGPANPLCLQVPADRAEDRSDNARSLVLRFRLGSFDFLDCGDLTWNVERKLVCPTDRIGPVDVFQVTHHGMDISNHPTLLASIAPTVAIMNNGPKKGGSPATAARIRDLSSLRAAYQLHKIPGADPTDAASVANPDPAGGQFVHVAVAPDGSKYTVRIGPDGEAREFASR